MQKHDEICLFVSGGNGPSGGKNSQLVAKSGVYAYIIKEGRWRQKASLITPRTRHGACVLGNLIYVAGGHNDKG